VACAWYGIASGDGVENVTNDAGGGGEERQSAVDWIFNDVVYAVFNAYPRVEMLNAPSLLVRPQLYGWGLTKNL
jgi:hypothetical protein